MESGNKTAPTHVPVRRLSDRTSCLGAPATLMMQQGPAASQKGVRELSLYGVLISAAGGEGGGGQRVPGTHVWGKGLAVLLLRTTKQGCAARQGGRRARGRHRAGVSGRGGGEGGCGAAAARKKKERKGCGCAN